MDFATLLSGYGRSVGLPDLRPDGNGVCRLVFDGDLIADVEAVDGTDRLHVYSELSGLPSADHLLVYRELMAAHLFGRATGPAYFGCDTGLGRLFLVTSLDLPGLDLARFADRMEAFVAQARFWRDKLDRIDQPGEIADEDEGPPLAGAVIRG